MRGYSRCLTVEIFWRGVISIVVVSPILFHRPVRGRPDGAKGCRIVTSAIFKFLCVITLVTLVENKKILRLSKYKTRF